MKTIFIIHGTGGTPEGNWFPWLKEKLEQEKLQVFVPRFPTPQGQSLEAWLKTFEAYKKYVNEESIFIAHSVGPSFVCAIHETLHFPVKACFFVSGFLGNIGIPEFDRLNDSFLNRDFDFEKIRTNCKNFYMCHGSDDPYVPRENAEKMSLGIGVEIDFIEGGGHLNAESGYKEFSELLEKILLQKSIF